jgi:hypothetical protein
LSFILRVVLILLVFAFVVYVIKAIARLSFHLRGAIKDVRKLREQVGGRPAVSADMVRCARCGAFVTSRDAVVVSAGNRARIFCSSDCMRLHVVK